MSSFLDMFLVSRGFARLLVLAMVALVVSASAQTCITASDMDDATRTALTNAGKRYFDFFSHGDSAALKQNSIASLASNFDSIETLVKDDQANFSQTHSTPRPPFLLKAEAAGPANAAASEERSEFLCGVFGAHGQTANSAEFVIPGLAPGNYGIVTLDANTAKGAPTVSFVLQQQGTEWKLGGLYVRDSQVGGHDASWFADQARTYKMKGETRDAWFYFLEARELAVPVPFMSTQLTDKLYDEAQAVKPSDIPGNNTIELASGGKTYKLTALFPLVVGKDLDLVVKYQSADVSNTDQTFQDNAAVMKAVIAKYPEIRDAFDGMVARAVEPSGKDYGSLLPMKEIK